MALPMFLLFMSHFVLKREHKLMHFLKPPLQLAVVIMARLVSARIIIQIIMVHSCLILTATISRQYAIHRNNQAQQTVQVVARFAITT